MGSVLADPGTHVPDRRHTRYRRPLTATLLPVVPLIALGLVWRWFLPSGAGLLLAALVFGLRDGLELTDTDAVVRSYGTTRVPWPAVTGLRPGPRWRGGVVLETDSWREVYAPAPCSWWGGPADADHVAEVEQWWIAHRGPSWRPRAPIFVHPTPAPRRRYRVTSLAIPLAVVGLLVAAANGAALWWPAGDFSVGMLEVVEPDLDHLGWLVLAAVTVGLGLGVALAVMARRILTAGAPATAPADAPEGRAGRILVLVAGAGALVAGLQWLGVVPAIGSLTMLAGGLAAAIWGLTLARVVPRFERRTGQTLLITNPSFRRFGLETRPRGAKPSLG